MGFKKTQTVLIVDKGYTIGYGGSVPHAGRGKPAYVGLRRGKAGRIPVFGVPYGDLQVVL